MRGGCWSRRGSWKYTVPTCFFAPCPFRAEEIKQITLSVAIYLWQAPIDLEDRMPTLSGTWATSNSEYGASHRLVWCPGWLANLATHQKWICATSNFPHLNHRQKASAWTYFGHQSTLARRSRSNRWTARQNARPYCRLLAPKATRRRHTKIPVHQSLWRNDFVYSHSYWMLTLSRFTQYDLVDIRVIKLINDLQKSTTLWWIEIFKSPKTGDLYVRIPTHGLTQGEVMERIENIWSR